jgi:hypothetical protein
LAKLNTGIWNMKKENKKKELSGGQNPLENLHENSGYFSELLNGRWPEKNMAILISHGIGNQKPIETLDGFTRGMAAAIRKYGAGHQGTITMEHHLQKKKSGDETYYWFDNFIRIRSCGNDSYIDVYEYYWANKTEEKITFPGIKKWLSEVVNGARQHYKDHAEMVNNSHDKSFFIDKNGHLNAFRYWFFLRFLGGLVVSLDVIGGFIKKYIRLIPLAGPAIAALLEMLTPAAVSDFTNVIGDIAIYNDPNPRSTNQDIRKAILNGCVKAIAFLLEPEDNGETYQYHYDKVVIAGHSLGSQVSFDAINRLTHQVNLCELKGYDCDGFRLDKAGNKLPGNPKISGVLDTFITFGSPLDKVAFFFTETSEEDEYIKRQVLENFHCFKQRKWAGPGNGQIVANSNLRRLFDEITWRNYFDNMDPVSGSLDYYKGLTNINCHFKKGIFTHSNYWKCDEFFGDLLIAILVKREEDAAALK